MAKRAISSRDRAVLSKSNPLNDGILRGFAESHLQQMSVCAHLRKAFMVNVLRGALSCFAGDSEA
jgi:hypothetical protein